MDWKLALDLPGAGQMQHVRKLMESRPILDRDRTSRLSLKTTGHHMKGFRPPEALIMHLYIRLPEFHFQ